MKFFYLIVPLFITSLIMVYQGEEISTVRLVLSGDQEIHTPLNDDSVVVVNGTLHLTPEAQVTKTLYMVGGELLLSGTVDNIVQLGGKVHVNDSGTINGHLSVFGGEYTSENVIAVEESEQFFSRLAQSSNEPYTFSTHVRTFFGQLAILLLIAFGIAKYFPTLLTRTITGFKNSFATNLAYGILLLLVVPSLLFILVFTGILIPVALVLIGISSLMLLLGYILLGATFGELIVRTMKGKERSLVYSTLAGVVALHLSVTIISFVPILTLFVMGTLMLASVGELFSSRFGLLERK